ncbi:hypothetical protein [Gramella sp. MAR_2010_147]|uniref:hypothetical protein n=1 Tax=Gramella sp. MAR_2010_147 TaxID=1250205 RepID=UPI000A77CB77|nr:hypothetical protein [Gramella sp. MAR_2010_147]
MRYDNSELSNKLDVIYIENEHEIENNLPYEQKEAFERGMEKFKSDDFLILIGGPIQTILTGCIGLLILVIRRKKIKRNGLNTIDWLAVFLSLFWLREVFNLVHSIIYNIVFQEGIYFGGDEMYISEYLGLSSGSLPIILGFIGLGVSCYVIFKIISKNIRSTFILSGITGGIAGFLIWFEILGPVLLP